jgi:hypothetical protein
LDNPLYIIDSREQKPYCFTGPSVVATLETGDYSLAGLESQVAVERKEINDLIACLTIERNRFERELQRGRSFDYFALVVEASLEDLANGRYRSQMNIKAAVQSLLAMSVRFRLPVWLVHNRAHHGQRITQASWTNTPLESSGGGNNSRREWIMGNKNQVAPPAWIEAGKKNMARYNQEVAEGKRPPSGMTHVLTISRKLRKYADARTREGKKRKVLLDGLVKYLGGRETITPIQQIHLSANIRPKLIVLMAISEYLDGLGHPDQCR